MSNPYEFDDFDENQIIKLDDEDKKVSIQHKAVEKPKFKPTFKSYAPVEENIVDDDDYDVNLEEKPQLEQPVKNQNRLEEIPEDKIDHPNSLIYGHQQLSQDTAIMLELDKANGKNLNSKAYTSYSNFKAKQNDYDDPDAEPPLLQDIGIQPRLIIQKMLVVLKFEKPTHRQIEMPDLTGPLFIAFLLGFQLLAAGKIYFGDIYAYFVIGNLLICLLFNLMSQVQFISPYAMMSVIGYSMLPLLIPGSIAIIVTLKNQLGIVLVLLAALWSSYAASNFVELTLKLDDTNRKGVFIYPLFLYYVSFVMLIIF